MDAKLKDLWLKALRSGEYEQTRETLFDGKGYCCLGVLCDVMLNNDLVPAGVSLIKTADYIEAGGMPHDLPGDFATAIGLRWETQNSVVAMNDGTDDTETGGQTFSLIADWLETAVSVSPADDKD